MAEFDWPKIRRLAEARLRDARKDVASLKATPDKATLGYWCAVAAFEDALSGTSN